MSFLFSKLNSLDRVSDHKLFLLTSVIVTMGWKKNNWDSSVAFSFHDRNWNSHFNIDYIYPFLDKLIQRLSSTSNWIFNFIDDSRVMIWCVIIFWFVRHYDIQIVECTSSKFADGHLAALAAIFGCKADDSVWVHSAELLAGLMDSRVLVG
jgi:hypothetical protein